MLIVHGGSGDRTAWKAVADLLARRFRVIRYTRPTYRLDPPPRGADAVAREVGDALDVATWIGEPVVLVGHSSGGVVALETVLRQPSDTNPFIALVLYEPPLDVTHSPAGARALRDSRAALDAGESAEAMQIHLRDLVGLPAPMVAAMFDMPPVREEFAQFAAGQIADNEMIDTLPESMARFAAVTLPVLLLSGDQSPEHLRRRSDDLAAALPPAPERTTLVGQGHAAHRQAPDDVADAITYFIDRLAR